MLSKFPEWRLDVHKFFNTLPVDDHIGDILVLILFRNVQWQFAIVSSDVAIASFQ